MYNKTFCGHSIPQHHLNNMQSLCLRRVFSRPFKPITSSQYRFHIIQKKNGCFCFPLPATTSKRTGIYIYISIQKKEKSPYQNLRVCFGSFFPSLGWGFWNLLEGGDRILQTGYHSMCHCLEDQVWIGWEGSLANSFARVSKKKGHWVCKRV